MKDPNFGGKCAFEKDGCKAYNLEIGNYIAFIFTNEEESHYYWYLAYTEGDISNNVKYDDTSCSRVDFATFEECVDDANKCLSKQDDSFFENSKYNWHIKPKPNNGISAILYMQTKRGVKLGLVLEKNSHDIHYVCYGFWNYNRNAKGVGGKADVIIFELEEKYLGDSWCPKVKDINALDSFVDEVISKTGILPSKRF